MPPLIPQLTYGKVVGYLFAMIGDGTDTDALPEQVPLTGTAIFTSPFKSISVLGVGIGVPSVIPVSIVAGRVTDGGAPEVRLVANDIVGANRTGWLYQVAFKDLHYTDNAGNVVYVDLDPFQLPVPTWNTGDAPVNILDYVPLDGSGPGVQIIRGPAGIGFVAGGTTGQALIKKSNADGDYGWGAGGGGSTSIVDNGDGSFTITG